MMPAVGSTVIMPRRNTYVKLGSDRADMTIDLPVKFFFGNGFLSPPVRARWFFLVFIVQTKRHTPQYDIKALQCNMMLGVHFCDVVFSETDVEPIECSDGLVSFDILLKHLPFFQGIGQVIEIHPDVKRPALWIRVLKAVFYFAQKYC